MDLPEKELKNLLSEKRYRHSVCVAAEALRLAEKYGANREKAYTAGLWHDVCKDFSDARLLQLFREFGIILDSVEAREPKLWHAIAGEAYLKRRFAFGDPDILSAVRYHTTARAGMTPLERVLYIADFTSADRDYPDVQTMRARAEESASSAMRYALRYTIRDLAERGRMIHPDTLHAYNELLFEEFDFKEKRQTI